jgi:hypothetical protein
VQLEGLGKLKKSNDFIGNLSRDLPACSIVHQPTTLSRAPVGYITEFNYWEPTDGQTGHNYAKLNMCQADQLSALSTEYIINATSLSD